jgi:hypothetical protein
MPDQPRVAIITPYYQENQRFLERCLTSVRMQDVPADHILVADGWPQTWIDDQPLRHIKLDRPHSDYGNAPRAVGTLLAINEGYEAIGFLDADNWLEADHVASCLQAAQKRPDCDYVVAKWNLRRPDESILPIPDDAFGDHVDTSCFFLLPGSYHVALLFGTMPREMSIVGDRVFRLALKGANLNSETVPHRTVNYHCLWPGMYRMAGEEPPPEAKADIELSGLNAWLCRQSPRALDIISRRAGVRLVPSPAAKPRRFSGAPTRASPGAASECAIPA